MAYTQKDFNGSLDTIKAGRVKQRANKFWIDYVCLRRGMDDLIKTGHYFHSGSTVWRNMKAQYGKGKIRIFGGAVEAYVFDAIKAVSFSVVGVE